MRHESIDRACLVAANDRHGPCASPHLLAVIVRSQSEDNKFQAFHGISTRDLAIGINFARFALLAQVEEVPYASYCTGRKGNGAVDEDSLAVTIMLCSQRSTASD